MKGLVAIAALSFLFIICLFLYSAISNKDRTNEIRENLKKLSEIKTIQECDSFAEKIDRIPNCDGHACFDSGSSYGTLMASCIAGVGVRNNEKNVCLDSERNKNICKKIIKIYPEVSKMPIPDMDVDKCSKNIEKECELEYLKKSTPEMQTNIECDSYKDQSDKDECFLELAIKNNDYNLCANIDTDLTTMKMNQEACYHYLAIRNNDEKICEKFKLNAESWPGRESVYAGNCEKLLSVFRNNNNISACDNISLSYYGSSTKNACLMFYAIFKHDSNLCDREDVYNKEICKKLASLSIK